MRTNPGANINTDWQINGIVKPAHINAITRSIQYDYVITPQMLEGKTGTVNVDTLLGGGVINGVTGTYRVFINANVPAAVTLYFPANSIGPSGTLNIHVYSIGPFAALLDESPANGVAYYFHSHGRDTAVTLKSMIPNMHVGSFVMETPIAMASGYSFTYETALEEMPYIPEGASASIVRQAWMSNSDGAPGIVYFDIESIDNIPPGLHLNVQTAISNGKIPVIRYDGALYYFDKEFIYNDSPVYCFAGRLDSDEWKTAIRVTSEGVTLGNVLGVNGTVAEGVHNSFPLGGKCGIANDDEDYPYLIFEPNTYAYTAKFNGYYGEAYVSNAGETVNVEYYSETTEVSTPYPCLMFVIYKNFVSESHNDSGIVLPPGFLVIDDSSNHTVFAERTPVDRIVEAQNYSVALIRNTFSLSPGMLYTTSYTVHGGFWKKESSSRGCSNAMAVGPNSIASGSAMSAAFNGGKAAGPISLATGANALSGAAYTASFGQNSIASALHAIAFGADSAALHMFAMVLAAYGISGMECQTVLGRYNKLDPDSPFVIGWGNYSIRKNIMRLDQDGNIFSGKRLDLANNIMPLFKLPDSDPASPGTEPVTGYWICDSKKQLVTAEEIVALHAMGMKFVLCEDIDPAMNSRLYVEQKCNITNSTIDIEFVSADNSMITKIVVQKEATADVTTASLYIASYTTTYLASMDQVKDMEEMFLVNLPCAANTLRFEFSNMDYDPTVAGVGSSGTWKKVSAKFHNVWDWTKSGTSFANAFSGSFSSIDNLVSVIAAGDTSAVTNMDSVFQGCTSLTSVPLFDTSAVTNMNAMFADCSNVEGGALALYQRASTQTTPPSNHTGTFINCGEDTVTGAAELAQIPASWGGTAP